MHKLVAHVEHVACHWYCFAVGIAFSFTFVIPTWSDVIKYIVISTFNTWFYRLFKACHSVIGLKNDVITYVITRSRHQFRKISSCGWLHFCCLQPNETSKFFQFYHFCKISPAWRKESMPVSDTYVSPYFTYIFNSNWKKKYFFSNISSSCFI